ncbi:peptide ABC transporter substrate-binding protein [uncultured Merdimonas sp.]|uniref:peptide ABC transporter substrate-binding protein n=1 Tax=uncultured Merdimonas sp. TaxID=2023269 RepID=UPI00320B8B8F
MKKRVLAALLTTAMTVTLLAGCGVPGGSDDGGDTEGLKRVTYSLREEPPTLDPQLMNSIPSATAAIHTCAGLTRNVEGEIRGDGAEDWDVSEDGLVYTFYLRDGLKWSDGEDLTAEDYVYGIQRLVNPETASGYSFLGAILKNGDPISKGEMDVSELGVTAPDSSTVEITLEHPATYFTAMTAMAQFCPARQDLVEEYGQDYAADPDKAAYSGPFVVSEWKHGDEIVLAKNEEYWDKDSIKLDEICLKTVADAKTGVAMWEEGELDITDVPTEMTEQYADNSEFVFDGANDYLALNMSEGRILQNKNLRLALNYAINRQEYIDLATNGVYEANTRYVLPDVNGYEEGVNYGEAFPYEAFPVEGDADKANEYLNAAMTELGVSDPAEITIELLTTDTDLAKKQAEVIQDQIQKAIGVTIEIRQVTYKQRLEMEEKKEFDMVFTGWVPDYPDAYSYLELWLNGSSYNHTSYNNPSYDALVIGSQTETDPKARAEMLFQAEQIFLEDAAVVPLQLRRIQLLVNENIENFNVYFVGYNYNLVYADIKE